MQKQVDKSLSTLKGFGLRSVFFFLNAGGKAAQPWQRRQAFRLGSLLTAFGQ